MTTQASREQQPRIALYSHDTMGLGHIRRNTLIAQTLIQPPVSASVLLLSGIRESGAFALPAGIDSLTLPAYHKMPDGNYRSRSLDIELDRLIRLRSQTLKAALSAFEPDLLIVDNVPRGALSEMDESLAMLRERGTRIVLGLRDIIDEPEVVARQWEKLQNPEAVRKYFDTIWIYGDARLYDTARGYGFDQLSVPVVNVGYLDPTLRTTAQQASNPLAAGGPYALCMMGGGQDGQALAEVFAQSRLPAGWRGIILTGSMMPAAARERLLQLTAERADIEIVDFVAEPLQLIRDAAAVVAMAGYNSTVEVLALNKRVMLVPRVKPRAEQWLRASRLAELGLVDCTHPDQLNPEHLSHWLTTQAPTPRSSTTSLDFGGLERVASQTIALLAEARSLKEKNSCR